MKINTGKKNKKPNTFDFLGFFDFYDKIQKEYIKVCRKTRSRKFNISLKGMNSWLKALRNTVKIKEW